MNITWIIVIALIGLIAAIGAIAVLVRQRAPRVPLDPWRVAQLRERAADAEARRLHTQLGERIAEERSARDEQPQRRRPATAEALWAGGV
ncbi:hypothetical protein [Agrococcus baldri]|uniref:Uncharacterized protein n=1 Tax=Agrococcus baldri TaxID=153730 RepID=A0AA87RL68_9MICO|nr:hypothetical protein [Agrococcus baldri]GEK81113.1 hypothetical protein ABA31_24640 [Agrococcus baldri]